jgi:acetate---CoA ligase (ADP-forming)
MSRDVKIRNWELGDGVSSMVRPASIAIVGVSDDPSNFGAVTVRNLRAGGYEGELYMVNPRRSEVLGLPSFGSVRELPEAPELVVVAVPAAQVESVVLDAGARGAQGALVYTSGFGEMSDPAGASQQERLVELAGESGMRLWGPNTAGFLDFHRNRAFTFADFSQMKLTAGGIGVVSQSAGLGMHFADMQNKGVGFSWVLLAGNSSDIDVADLAAFLVDDDDTRVVVIILEGIKDGRRLVELGQRADAAGKPVLVYKTARSASGATAARTHTGSLVGDLAVFESACREAGMIVVDSIEELTDHTGLFLKAGKARNRGIGVISSLGGAGVMCADAAEEFDVELPPPGQETLASLRSFLPSFGVARNPVDLTANTHRNPAAYLDVLADFIAEPAFGAVVVPVVLSIGPVLDYRIDELRTVAATVDKPICALWLSTLLEGHGAERLDADPRVVLFRSARGAFKALRSWHEWSFGDTRSATALDGEPQGLRPEGIVEVVDEALLSHDASTDAVVSLGETASYELLRSAGIQVADHGVATSSAEAVATAESLGFPVVCKIVADKIDHKSDIGGVIVDVADADGVREAFDHLSAIGSDVIGTTGAALVQRQVRGVEVLVAGRRDKQFGPVVTIGVGGTLVEVLRDTASMLAPVSREWAGRMLDQCRVGDLCRGLRGEAAADREALLDAVVRIGSILVVEPRIREIEINPLMATPDGAVAVDALIVCSSSEP